MHLFQNNFNKCRQISNNRSHFDNKKKHMFSEEELFDLALDLSLSEMIFGSFLANQTGALTSSI